jgi:hypothetical protein
MSTIFPVQRAVAAPEVQWLLCFHLACRCQELQHKSKKQQRQQQQQPPPWEQLFAALGVPDSVQYSSYYTFNGRETMTIESLLMALVCQLGCSSRVRQILFVGPKQSATQLGPAIQAAAAAAAAAAQLHPATPAAAAAAAEATPSALPYNAQQQQQQQQVQGRVLPSTEPTFWPELEPEDHCVLPAKLVQPLLLTVLQLCSKLKPVAGVIARGLWLADELLIECLHSSSMVRLAVALQETTPVPGASVACTERGVSVPRVDKAPAAAEMEQAYQDALRAIAQPLLHAVAPAALKAVRQVEQGLSRRAVSSSVEALSEMTAEQSAAREIDGLLDLLGKLVLRLVAKGEYSSCCCTLNLYRVHFLLSYQALLFSVEIWWSGSILTNTCIAFFNLCRFHMVPEQQQRIGGSPAAAPAVLPQGNRSSNAAAGNGSTRGN